jgi:predicted metalloprotease
MKWEGHRRSENVEDRRGDGGAGGGGLPRMGPRIGGRGLGIGSIAIALVAGWVFGINPLTVLGLLGGIDAGPAAQAPAARAPAQDPQSLFVSTVLADTEDVWNAIFKAGGSAYREPTLVLFRGATPTACGTGQSAMGPFYCPGDQKVYIDLEFFQTLSSRMGAPGDFAQAYVVAHEVGHHVQGLLGVTQKVEALRGKLPKAQMNAMSVRVELQADCLAGVWTHHSQKGKGWLDQSDVQEALNAASRIGDDTLQRQSQGTVVPESFTHGTSAQRMRWFSRGMQDGSVAGCNTFDTKTL